jgi:hypothetical protein
MLNKETEYIDTWPNIAYVFNKTDNKTRETRQEDPQHQLYCVRTKIMITLFEPISTMGWDDLP